MKLARAINLVVLFLMVGATVARAADDAPATNEANAAQHADDEAAIRASGAAFLDAYNARDAKKLAALWSPEAVYVDPLTAEETVGREAIEKVFADAFSDNQDAKLTTEDVSIEFVSPNVAVVRGTAHVTQPGGESDDSEFTSVRVKQGGQWLIDRVSEIEKEKPLPSNYEHLKELEWMVGSWHDDDPRPSIEIQTDCEWAKNKNFLTRSFAVAIGNQVNKSGMQIIGWDAGAKQIRSWVFDSDGGFVEGTWKQKGDKWFIQNAGTLPDGSKTSGTNIVTHLDDNSFKWESVNREIDGELQPNVDPVIVVRKAD
ncbi:MAG TPA: nuclear transport factor 2 family protein [Lacipirellulaceae bacterium]